jgi:hypothetical protein
MKFFLWLELLLVLAGCSTPSEDTNAQKKKKIPESKTLETLQPAKPDTISINAVGDIMFGTNFPNTAKMPPNNGKNLLDQFTGYLKDADISFGNAEGVFLNSGGVPKGYGGQVYCFRQPTYMAQYFLENGFDLLSVANNHVADFGEVGLKSTDSVLRSLPIAFAGSLNRPTTIINIRGVLFGLAAFAPHKGSVDMNNISNAVQIVKALKKKCHMVMVSFHGGAEGVSHQRVPKQVEIFYGQNRGNVYDFAHKMIDAGADLVIGHGPHVARAMELYKEKFIAYSLGNFCTYGMFGLGGESGNASLLKLFLNEKGNFLKGEIISGKQYGEGGPVLDQENKSAFYTIKNLTELDFPNSGLIFENGLLKKK